MSASVGRTAEGELGKARVQLNGLRLRNDCVAPPSGSPLHVAPRGNNIRPELGGEGRVVRTKLGIGRDGAARISVPKLGGAERSVHD